jgi:hypothetical protein
MWTDIRWPIGLFFSILGVLLVAYGVASSSAIYESSLGINVNLDWGGVLLVFGLVMSFLGRRGRRTGADGSSSSSSPGPGGEM